MVYVSNGQVLDSRSQSPWRLSFLVDLFWGAVEFIGLYFKTLIQPNMTKDGNCAPSRSDGRGPPGPPGGRRRMGRIAHGGGPDAPPMGGGG
ncbi:selenoprotein K [Morone saxatilis]|uniref:selenoprotein K n=1 Tax=Morone saxatilis TaxID=34816 RepID=UPI0015E21328|nr:selenoprotein K [Morone saxatilis]